MKHFQDIVFIWIRTYREIFKSVLVYKVLVYNVFSASTVVKIQGKPKLIGVIVNCSEFMVWWRDRGDDWGEGALLSIVIFFFFFGGGSVSMINVSLSSLNQLRYLNKFFLQCSPVSLKLGHYCRNFAKTTAWS